MSHGDWAAADALARGAERAGGAIGVVVRDGAGERIARHGERRFRAAGTVKVPILIAAYRQVERGTLALADRHLLREANVVPGSGVLRHLRAGLEVTLGDLLALMIAVSDNTAANLVLDRVGLAAVIVTMQSLGMTDSVLGRPMLGRPRRR